MARSSGWPSFSKEHSLVQNMIFATDLYHPQWFCKKSPFTIIIIDNLNYLDNHFVNAILWILFWLFFILLPSVAIVDLQKLNMLGWLCCPFFLFQNTLLSRQLILINTLTLIISSLFFIAHKRLARYWWSASPPGNIHITTSTARRLSERLHRTTLLQNTPRFLTHERFISISHSFFRQMSEYFFKHHNHGLSDHC